MIEEYVSERDIVTFITLCLLVYERLIVLLSLLAEVPVVNLCEITNAEEVLQEKGCQVELDAMELVHVKEKED